MQWPKHNKNAVLVVQNIMLGDTPRDADEGVAGKPQDASSLQGARRLAQQPSQSAPVVAIHPPRKVRRPTISSTGRFGGNARDKRGKGRRFTSNSRATNGRLASISTPPRKEESSLLTTGSTAAILPKVSKPLVRTARDQRSANVLSPRPG